MVIGDGNGNGNGNGGSNSNKITITQYICLLSLESFVAAATAVAVVVVVNGMCFSSLLLLFFLCAHRLSHILFSQALGSKDKKTKSTHSIRYHIF